MLERELTECSCNVCKRMCKRAPCYPTPKQVVLLIAAGFKDRLEPVTYHPINKDEIWPVIAPKATERGCTFFTEDEKCSLHDLGLKPMEGQAAIHNKADDGLRRGIASMWVGELGEYLLMEYKATPLVEIIKILRIHYSR